MKKLVIFHICALPVIRQGWTPPPLEKFSGSAPGVVCINYKAVDVYHGNSFFLIHIIYMNQTTS